MQVPVGNPTLIGLDLTLTSLISIIRRRKILTCTQTRYNKNDSSEQASSISEGVTEIRINRHLGREIT
jgi:hypothetical protein